MLSIGKKINNRAPLEEQGFTPFETTLSSFLNKSGKMLKRAVSEAGAGCRRPPKGGLSRAGFTLIELVLTVALTAVGMVFILGAFNQCALAHANAEKEIAANYALTNIITKFDACKRKSPEERCLELISAEYNNFNLTRVVSQVVADFGSENSLIQDNFYQEEFRLSWKLGRRNRGISFVRYVQSKKK